MDNFLTCNPIVREIVLATYVLPVGGGTHKQRPSHGLALNLAGEKTYSFDDGKQIAVRANEIVYLPKGSTYTVSSTVPGKMYCINFQIQSERIFAPSVFTPTNVDEVLKAYQAAEKAWTRGLKGKEYKVLSELYKILYELQRMQAAPYLPKTKQIILQPAVENIHKHYTEELIDVQKLSALCGISYDYLRQLFEKFYGVSPIKYINGLKLKRAKELLSSGLYSVREAAQHAGFSDLSHFSRFFKANVGVSPNKYVQSLPKR